MLSLLKQDTNHQQNHGVLVVQFPVSLVFLVLEHTVQVKELLEICVEEEECLHQPKYGEDGTDA